MNLLKLKKSTKNKIPSYYDLPAREKKRIIKEAIRGANKEQLDLIKRYKKFKAAQR